MKPAPGVYTGTIRHRRFAPRQHQFQYALFMVLLDVDRLRDAMRVSWFTSYNRWNWAGFDERDHLGNPASPLRERLRQSALAAGEALPEGSVYLLTHLRYLGYVFNPISLFYCCGRDGDVQLVLAEVSNTYGGRHCYWLRPGDGNPHRFRAVTPKSLYVSPFMESAVDYEFVLTPPGPTLVVHMNVSRTGAGNPPERLFDATLTLEQKPWDARTVRSTLLRFPWMTAKVIAAIHWEALKLRLKRLPVMPRMSEGQ